MNEQNKPELPIQLGELETEIMNVIWERGEATVQDVKDALEAARSPAYTTVMTVMSRLAEKRLLKRYKEGRVYVYTPTTPREKLAGSMLSSLVQRVYNGATGNAIAHLLETETDVDEAELDRLEALIQARRKERRS